MNHFQEVVRFLFIPPVFLPSGYSPTIKGQLLHVDTTSSMQYRTLLEAEMLAVRRRRTVHLVEHSQYDMLMFNGLPFALVPRYSQLPPGVEHAPVVAV